MAHVVNVCGYPGVAEFVSGVCEVEGHTVTRAGTSFWQALAALRSVLHPVICVFEYDGTMGDFITDNEQMQALAANLDSLRRHAYIQISAELYPLPPPLDGMSAGAYLHKLPYPFQVRDLIAAINAAAAHLGAPAGSPGSAGQASPSQLEQARAWVNAYRRGEILTAADVADLDRLWVAGASARREIERLLEQLEAEDEALAREQGLGVRPLAEEIDWTEGDEAAADRALAARRARWEHEGRDPFAEERARR